MSEREKLYNLPKSMAERAMWARNAFKDNNDNIDFDDDMLPWAFDKNDCLWYSFDGNYSASSPQEKRNKALERKTKYENMEDVCYKRLEDQLYWSKVREKILLRDDYTCQMCNKKGKTKLHIHHILKRREGGKDFFDNLITVCPKYHSVADRKLYNPDWEV